MLTRPLFLGNAAGLGETRKKELVKSGMTLGLRDEDDVFVVDNPYAPHRPDIPANSKVNVSANLPSADFPDSMTETWDEHKIASLLVSAFAPKLAKQKPTEQPVANIDVLITFDDTGVSSHPNHISLYHGARRFVANLLKGRAGWASPVDLYTLRSVNVARKFTSILDVFATMATWATVQHADKAHPGGLVFLSQLMGEGALPTAWSAMTTAHQSQMVWFRYLWITFSRYMVINDLQLEKVKA